MARRRVYRHHIRCPDLGSNRTRRDEFSNGQQACRCGDCRPCCVPAGAYRRPGRAVKAQAIAIYIEGSSLSAIGRVLGYSAPAVLGWVKNGQHTLRRLRERSKQRTEGAACDELWTYRGVRREIWWI